MGLKLWRTDAFARQRHRTLAVGRRSIIRVLAATYLALSLLFLLADAGSAATFATQSPMDTITDDLYFAGQTLEINYPIDGDVVGVAQRVYINAAVGGTVAVLAQEVIVGPAGVITGTARVAGQYVRVNGKISNDLVAVGGDIWISREGSVGRDVIVAGGTLGIDGMVGRDVLASGQSLAISGRIQGPVRADVERLEIGSGAQVGGKITYSAKSDARVDPGARLAGGIERVPPPEGGPATQPTVGAVVLDRLRSMVGPLLLGLLLVLLFPAAITGVAELALRRLLAAFGLGILALLIAPIMLLVLFVLTLIIGGVVAPVALTGVLAFVLSLGNVVVGMAVGAGILRLLRVEGPSSRRLRMLAELLLGVVVLTVVSVVPVVNVAVSVVSLAITFGAFILGYIERRSLLQWGITISRGEVST